MYIDNARIPNLIRINLYIKELFNIKDTYLSFFLYKIIKADGKKIFNSLKGMTEKEILKYLKINKTILHKKYNVNRYVNIFFAIENVNDSIYFLQDNKSCCDIPRVCINLKRDNFIYQYYKHNSKKKLYNQLKKNRIYVYDSCNMYLYLRENIKGYKLNFDNDIKYLHDILSKDNDRFRANKENKKISANKHLKEVLAGTNYNGIEYKLAKDTSELVLTGSKMNICVGSYGEKAVKKQCIIAIGYKAEEPVTCMEFRKDKNTNVYSIWQVKKPHNHLPDDEEVQYLIDLFVDNDINIKTNDLSKEDECIEIGIY